MIRPVNQYNHINNRVDPVGFIEKDKYTDCLVNEVPLTLNVLYRMKPQINYLPDLPFVFTAHRTTLRFE